AICFFSPFVGVLRGSEEAKDLCLMKASTVLTATSVTTAETMIARDKNVERAGFSLADTGSGASWPRCSLVTPSIFFASAGSIFKLSSCGQRLCIDERRRTGCRKRDTDVLYRAQHAQ